MEYRPGPGVSYSCIGSLLIRGLFTRFRPELYYDRTSFGVNCFIGRFFFGVSGSFPGCEKILRSHRVIIDWRNPPLFVEV